MRKSLAILLLLLGSQLSAQSDWFWLQPLPSGNLLTSIEFSDPAQSIYTSNVFGRSAVADNSSTAAETG